MLVSVRCQSKCSVRFCSFVDLPIGLPLCFGMFRRLCHFTVVVVVVVVFVVVVAPLLINAE